MNIAGIGTIELMVIMLVALIVLGPDRMMDVARNLGKAMRSFQKATSDLPNIIEREVNPPSLDSDVKVAAEAGPAEESSKEGPVPYRRGVSPPQEPEVPPTPEGGSSS